MPKYMLIMRTTDAAQAASADIDFEEIINAMGAYNAAMMEAGVMVGGDGLTDAAQGAVVTFGEGDERVVTDGPYGETRELFNGFWMLDVPAQADAVEWAKHCPLGPGNALEVRRVTDESDFEEFADNEFLQAEEGWREQIAAREAEKG